MRDFTYHEMGPFESESNIEAIQKQLKHIFREETSSKASDFLYDLKTHLNEPLEDDMDDETLQAIYQTISQEYQRAEEQDFPVFRTMEDEIKELPEILLDQLEAQGVMHWEMADFPVPEESENVVFLLGAGASKASGIPTVGGLLAELLDRARKIRREDLDNLVEFCEENDIDNIENLLTAVYISDFAASDRSVTDLVNYFLYTEGSQAPSDIPRPDVTSVNFLQETLQTLFGLLTSTMISEEPNITHEKIREFAENHGSTSLITTNYDCLMDEELLQNDIKPSGSIGSANVEGDVETIDFIKMHGSINWAYCESCQNVGKFDYIDLKNNYEKDHQSFPVIGICPYCDGRRRQLLVPPISFKFLMFPPLIDLWYEARERIHNADYIVVIGYSFSDADAYISKIISEAMESEPERRMIIVNPDPDIAGKIRDRYERGITDFNAEERIINIPGYSEEVVPDIIDKWLNELESPESELSDDATTAEPAED